MADNNQSVISASVERIRNAVYGKDVREAIASGIETCYNYVGGKAAIEAADRAVSEVSRLSNLIDESNSTLTSLETTASEANSWIKISEEQPTEAANKIWIKPRAEQEYKIATYDAYSELWEHVNELDQVYDKGHGGIVSVTLDSEYVDPDIEPGATQYKKRYVIKFSDGNESDFYINDGKTGDVGPVDEIDTVELYFHKGVLSNGKLVQSPPADGWTAEIPGLSGGEYLWTQSVITYKKSKNVSYIYSVARQGKDGSGAVDSVKLQGSEESMVGDVVLPVDNTPTENSDNLVYSGGVFSAIEYAIQELCGKTVESLMNV